MMRYLLATSNRRRQRIEKSKSAGLGKGTEAAGELHGVSSGEHDRIARRECAPEDGVLGKRGRRVRVAGK